MHSVMLYNMRGFLVRCNLIKLGWFALACQCGWKIQCSTCVQDVSWNWYQSDAETTWFRNDAAGSVYVFQLRRRRYSDSPFIYCIESVTQSSVMHLQNCDLCDGSFKEY